MRKIVPLPNGMRVVIVPQADVSTFIGVAAALTGGSRYEQENEVGITHLLEHLMVRKSRTYQTVTAFAEALDRKTMDLSATTDPTTLVVHFETTRSTFVDGIAVLADLVLRPDITRVHMKNELDRIAEEHMMAEDDPEQTAEELVETLVFRGSPLARPVDGDPDQLRSITVERMLGWHNTVVRGSSMTIAVTGDLDTELAQRTIRRHFQRVKASSQLSTPVFRPRQQRSRIVLKQRPGKAVQIALAFPTFGFGNHDRFILSVLNNHLGDQNRWSTRLAERLLGEGLVYWAWSKVWHYRDAGIFKIATGVRPEHVTTVLTVLREELERLVTTRLSTHDLDLATAYLKRDARIRKYSPGEHASFYARQLLANDDIVTASQFVQRMNAIRTRDVLRVARSVLQPERMNVALIGPIYGLNDNDVQALLTFRDGRSG